MRGTFFAAILVALGISSIGCKSMPSLTWWKTASKTNIESTAVAHTAPELPSEIAIQTEALAATTASPASAATSVAAPYSATAPTAYPSTGAPSFTPAPASNTVAAAPASNSNLGSIAMPYNPNAVPAPAQAATEPAIPAASADRYAAAPPAASYTPANTATATITTSSPAATGGYPIPESHLNNQMASAPANPAGSSTKSPISSGQQFGSSAPQTTGSTTLASATSGLGNRYGNTQVAAPVAAQPSYTAPPTTTPQAPAQTSVASSEPYRPGGTSTYPGDTLSQPALEVASRPQSPTDGSTGSESQVPNLTTPDGQSPQQSPATTPRYW